jgi:hypothetical protein
MLSDLHKIRCRSPLQKIVEQDEFCENQLSDNHTSLKWINEFLPTLFTLRQHCERN